MHPFIKNKFKNPQFYCRNVQSILKSPELDAKYEKFSTNASPKTSRKKFLSSRQPAKRKRKTSASSSKTRETSLRNGSAMTGTGTNCSSNLSSGNGRCLAPKLFVSDVIHFHFFTFYKVMQQE